MALLYNVDNELRDLEADLLRIVCKDVEVEPVLQDVSREQLNRGSNRAQDARLDIRARGFWEPQSSAFFDVRVCHPNAESYRDHMPKQIYRIHENDKKRLYSRRVLDVEHGSFTPLVFTTTGGMGEECLKFHSRLAELIAAKKGERYSDTNLSRVLGMNEMINCFQNRLFLPNLSFLCILFLRF